MMQHLGLKNNIMETNEWVAVIGLALAMLTAIYSVIKFVTKSIMRELLPNSGESMRDSIEDTKIELRVLSARVDSIYEILGGK
jgi:hypothetical protein